MSNRSEAGYTLVRLIMSARSEVPLLVVFIDLTGYAVHSQRVTDTRLAEIIDAYYERVGARVEGGGGRVVKFIGDGALIVVADDSIERGVDALLALEQEVDAWMESLGWTCRLVIKAHYGPVVSGPFGAAGGKRFDVLGKNVNAAARLAGGGVAFSPEALRRLTPAQRKRVKKLAAR